MDLITSLTLTSYHRGIDRYLRDKQYPYSMVKDREFSTSKAVLASKRKQLKMSGKGSRPHAAQPLTPDEEALLKETKCIGVDSPQQLLNKMWLNNTMLFGIRGGTENRNLRWGDVMLKVDVQGIEYLEFNERCTKTRTGASSHCDQRAFKPKQYAHAIQSEECPVHAYKQFMLRRPQGTCTPESPFYLGINLNRRPDSDVWYKNQPLGENTLRGLMKKMAEKANLPGKKTNHSARKTTCTKLLHQGLAPTTIQQLTGHKNVQSVNNYAVASDQMQKNMSDILSNNPGANTSATLQARPAASCSLYGASPAGAAQPSMSTYQASALSRHTSTCEISANSGQVFQNAQLQNCKIVINNNYNTCSSPPQPKEDESW